MTIRIRRDTAANWTAANPTLAGGQLGYETNTGRIKVGDGTTAWTSLAYRFETGGGGAAWGSITGTLSSQADLQTALNLKANVASPTFTGTVTLPAGQVVNGVTLSNSGSASLFLDQTGAYTAPSGGGGGITALTGDVTASGTGSVAATIAAGAVTLSKMANLAASTILGNNTGSPATPLALTPAQVKTLLAIAAGDVSGLGTLATQSGTFSGTSSGTNTGDQTITLTGNVTGSGTGSFATTIATGVVTLAMQANMATGSLVYRKTAGSGVPEINTLATLKTDLGLTGTNSGDQTITLTSDVTGSGTGSFAATIAAGAVTLAKQANVPTATIMGRVTAATGVQEALTGTQATTLLDTFTTALKGLAPASGGGTTNFLRADGTWAAAGGGSPITLQDEGANITTALATLNVVGLGAVASGTSSATLTINGLVTAAPATDQANWAPSGFGAGTGTVKAQPTTNSFITGLTAGATDQSITLVNDSTFVICLETESGASTAANRIARTPTGSVWLLPNEVVQLRYSATLARWVIFEQSRDVFAVGARGQLFLPGQGTTVLASGVAGVSTTATVSHNAPTGTPTNEFTEYASFQVTNSTASGTSSVRAAANHFMRGASAGRQGFFVAGAARFTALGATGSVRAGVTSSVVAIAALNAVQTQCLFIGADTTDTNLRIYNGDGTAATPVNLGANFPTPSATAAYEYCFYAPPNASVVRYMVRRLDSRFVAEGTLTANLPTNTTALGHRLETFVGLTAVANTAQASYLLTAGL